MSVVSLDVCCVSTAFVPANVTNLGRADSISQLLTFDVVDIVISQEFPDLPIHVHTHDTAGTGVASMLAASAAGTVVFSTTSTTQ